MERSIDYYFFVAHVESISNSVAGDVTNVILDPIFMFVLRMKVGGAAIAHVISQ